MATLNYKVTPDALMVTHYNPTKLKAILDEFVDSGKPIAEFVYAKGEYASPESCASTVSNAARKWRKTNVIVCQRKDKIYLVRKDMNNG